MLKLRGLPVNQACGLDVLVAAWHDFLLLLELFLGDYITSPEELVLEHAGLALGSNVLFLAQFYPTSRSFFPA